MANTTFSEIRGYIRAIVGDYDSECFQYSDSVLNSHIRLTILIENDPLIAEGSSEEFDRELTNEQKAKVSLKSSLNLISPMPDTFSYRNPITSVTRKGGIRQLTARINTLLSELNGGALAIAYESDFEAMINSFEKFTRDLQAAL